MGTSLFAASYDCRKLIIRCRPIYNELPVLKCLVHEIIHSASYRYKEKITEGDTTLKKYITGFCVRDITTRITDSGTEEKREMSNWSLNEGVTETLTIAALRRYGIDYVPSSEYIYSVEWALNFKALVGEKLLYNAYFSGDSEPLIKYVNSLCDDKKCWDMLVESLDAAGTNREYLRTIGNIRWINSHRKRVRRIFAIMNTNKMKGIAGNEG